jgi:hypothetical protein
MDSRQADSKGVGESGPRVLLQITVTKKVDQWGGQGIFSHVSSHEILISFGAFYANATFRYQSAARPNNFLSIV